MANPSVDRIHTLQNQINNNIDSMIRLLHEAKTNLDHPATIMTTMLNVSSTAARISYTAGCLRGPHE